MNVLGLSLFLLFAQNARIEGIVVQAGSNNPLSKARVELQADADFAPVLDSITTDADGRFMFEGVRQGRLRLTVTRSGYFRRPLSVTVAGGQSPSFIQLPMVPTGAISGRIYDSAGQPMGNVEVQVLKPSYPEGRRELTYVQSVQTNDLGEYRLFWLPPGRYYLAAVPPGADSPNSRMYRSGSFGVTMRGNSFLSSADGDPAVTPEGLRVPPFGRAADRYVPIYFNGTNDEQAASPIDVRAGADLTGVNVVITQVREHHVRGMVVDGNTGQKVATIDDRVLNANRWTQINNILLQYAPGLTQGYAHVTRTAGTNPFIAYAVINDGAQAGQRSGDGAFLSSAQ